MKEPQQDICSCVNDALQVHMMKFPRPRILVHNEFPDLLQDQPKILQDLVTKIAKPIPNSPEDKYLDETIEYIKRKRRNKTRKSNSTTYMWVRNYTTLI